LRLCPYGEQYLKQMITKCEREVIVFCILIAGIIIFWNAIVKTASVTFILESLILAGYLVIMEVPKYKLQVKENKIYRELLTYLSRVKHRYASCRYIANAVYDAAENMSYEVQRLAAELYRVLMVSDRKEEVREYVLYHRTNRYLKLFLIQAYEASEKGDVILKEGTTLFSKNVEHLRLEVMEELYRRKKQAHEFAGYIFVTVSPVFMMPVLKQWGLEFAPELEQFYMGTGKLLELVTVCVTVIIYGLINRAKDIVMFHETSREKLWNVEWIYNNSISLSVIHRFERAEGRFSQKIRQLLLFTGERITYGKLCFQICMIGGGSFLFLLLFSMGIHTTGKRCGYVLFAFFGGILLGTVPVIKLWFQVITAKAGAVQEVRQFQSVILMERNLQGMTVTGLLEDMEVFSQSFRNVLRRCINMYGSGAKDALLQMKKEGGYLHESFAELADAFISVDEVGISMAFAEVENNRTLLDRMSRLEAEIALERKKDNTDLLSKIPAVLAVGMYFILPFFMYSLKGLYEVFDILEQMKI